MSAEVTHLARWTVGSCYTLGPKITARKYLTLNCLPRNAAEGQQILSEQLTKILPRPSKSFRVSKLARKTSNPLCIKRLA